LASTAILLGVTACTAAASRKTLGWSLDRNYAPPTKSYLVLHGPAAEIAAVIDQGRRFGWSAQEHAELPSGSAFALVVGPADTRSNEQMWDLLLPRKITVGLGMAPESRLPSVR
jgi:hypothetical protein